MTKYVKAVECAEKISEKLGIPLGDLVDVFAEIPAADVVPRAELAREIFEEIYAECFDQYGYIDYEALADLKKKYAADEEITPLF